MKKGVVILLLLQPMLLLGQSVRILSYNVENFFDYEKDSVKDDISFTPDGDHFWGYNRFKTKSTNIAKAITAAGGWEGAAIVGLYEIENNYVLETLTKYSPLKNRGYKYIHYESSDPRGIDIAMLYDPTRVDVIKSFPIPAICLNDTLATRDLLYVKALLLKSDTIHFFLCHTPSRRGGVEASSWKRECVMGIVRSKIDSIFSYSDANIIVMGDFNDYPNCKSVNVSLGAVKPSEKIEKKCLYNMFWIYQERGQGTYKYQGEWNMLDQIIVSGSLLDKGALYTSQDYAKICYETFLMEEDKKFFGEKPLRTYNGRRYLGGYSDHLPIYIDLFLNSEK